MIQCDTGAIVYSKAPFCIASLIKAADDYVDSVQTASLNSHVLSVMDLRAAPGTSGNSDEQVAKKVAVAMAAAVVLMMKAAATKRHAYSP